MVITACPEPPAPLPQQLKYSPRRPTGEQSDSKRSRERSLKVALCVHAFYREVFASIIPYIVQLSNADLYITCQSDDYEYVAELLATSDVSATILKVANVGMDVLPFMEAVHQFALHEYLAVAKVHTKNDATKTSALFGSLLVRHTIGSCDIVERLRVLFADDPTLMLAGSNDAYKHLHYMMYNNRVIYQALCGLLGVVPRTNVGFFAGTMFWIRGSMLAGAVMAFRAVREAFVAEGWRQLTGSDGSVAHAVERIWLALSPIEDPNIALVFSDVEARPDLIYVASQSAILAEPLRRMGVTECIQYHRNARENAASVRSNPLFDPEYYATQIQDAPNPGIDPALHYVLYGELMGKNPSVNFNTTFYRLSRPDVPRAHLSVLRHYINHGRRESMVIRPTTEDWLSLAERYQLFDEAFYRKQVSRLPLSFSDPMCHYAAVGDRMDQSTSKSFNPARIPATRSGNLAGENRLAAFMRDHFMDERRRYDELIRVVENNDFHLVPELAIEIEGVYGDTACLRIAKAFAYLHHGRWEDMAELLEEHWQILLKDDVDSRHVRNLADHLRQPNTTLEAVKPERRSRAGRRICIYTALFGDIDILPGVLTHADDIDFICFTDKHRTAQGWTHIRVADPGLGNHNMNAKIFKILPHEYLIDYEYSLFVDANSLLCGRLTELIENYLLGHDFVMWAHPRRNDAYSEVVAIVEAARHPPEALLRQMRAYEADGFPRNCGLYEASFIWRAHAAPKVRALMAAWWTHIQQFSKRDQLSLAYLTWKEGCRPLVLPFALGTARENPFFEKLSHAKLPHQLSVGLGEQSVPKCHPTRRKVWVLYGAQRVQSGSTLLRGQQLIEVLQTVVDETIDLLYSSFDEIQNAIVILTKSYVAQHGVERVASLRARGNFVLLDLVDAQPSTAIVDAVDGLIASSIRAYRSYRILWPGKPTYHITHHVDLRLNGLRQEFETARIGYFGERLNTLITDQIARSVDFTPIDTSRPSTDWIDTLSRYNTHYAIRQSRNIDAHKPFLKGFVAAHYRANIIIQRNAGDASLYLGTDYPYLVSDIASEEEILTMVKHVRDSFGSPEWAYGLEVMKEVRARSSLDTVRRELAFMMADVLGPSAVKSEFRRVGVVSKELADVA